MHSRRIILILLMAALTGCGKNDTSISKSVGNKVGQSVTDFASGVGEGIDQQLQVQVELSKQLTDSGLSKTVAKYKILKNTSKNTIVVYIIAAKAFKGTILARAFEKGDQEVGRCEAKVDFAADDAKYVEFSFDAEMDSRLVVKYVLDEKKQG
jgi:hypothetical protein